MFLDECVASQAVISALLRRRNLGLVTANLPNALTRRVTSRGMLDRSAVTQPLVRPSYARPIISNHLGAPAPLVGCSGLLAGCELTLELEVQVPVLPDRPKRRK